MPKLKLNLEALQVDSFEITDDGKARRGTVRGHADYTHPAVCDTAMDCSYNTCASYCQTACGTCYETCERTCEMSCHYGSSC
jgi:hypothetical protein